MARANWRDETLTKLMQHAQAGDEGALETLLTILRPPLLRYLTGRFMRAWSTDVAEDVVQETLMRVAERITTYRGSTDGAVYTWAFTIARNFSLASLRSAPPGAMSAFGSVTLTSLEARLEAALPPSGELDPDEPTASAHMSRLVVEAYDALPPDAALLIWHRVIEGLAWADIAAEHATTPAGAKRRFQRMQQTIRRRVIARLVSVPTDDAAQLLEWLQRVRRS